MSEILTETQEQCFLGLGQPFTIEKADKGMVNPVTDKTLEQGIRMKLCFQRINSLSGSWECRLRSRHQAGRQELTKRLPYVGIYRKNLENKGHHFESTIPGVFVKDMTAEIERSELVRTAAIK